MKFPYVNGIFIVIIAIQTAILGVDCATLQVQRPHESNATQHMQVRDIPKQTIQESPRPVQPCLCIKKRKIQFPLKPIRGILVNHAFQAALSSRELEGEKGSLKGSGMYIVTCEEVPEKPRIAGSIWSIIPTRAEKEYIPEAFEYGKTAISVIIYSESAGQYLYPLKDAITNTMNTEGKLQLSISKFYILKEYNSYKFDSSPRVGPEFTWDMYKLRNGDLAFCNRYRGNPGEGARWCISLSSSDRTPYCETYWNIHEIDYVSPYMWTFVSPYGPFQTPLERVEDSIKLSTLPGPDINGSDGPEDASSPPPVPPGNVGGSSENPHSGKKSKPKKRGKRFKLLLPIFKHH